ncbi:ATP-binding protein [Metamycoplasma hominis]|nr:ATP-binding protein [Metamycoplasma hominis]
MFEDIVGLNKAKEAFIEKIILPFKHKEIFEKFNKKIGGGILLYGLPGTGKTMFAEATSNELNALFIPIKCSDIKTKWYGESEQKIHKIFERARKQEKAIIFFDEFEAIGTKRMDNAISEGNDIVPQLLSEMQGIDNLKNESNIIVIAATNKPWMIDSAFLRPGRFDEKIYIPLPDYESRKKMFEIQLSSLPIADNFDFDYLASITENFNGADIKEVCEKIKMSAIKKNINNNQEHKIEMEDVKQIEKDIKSSVNLQDIQKLKEFEKNFY